MKKRIKELALQAGFPPHWTTDDGYLIEKWEKFAELVRADEREGCAKECEEDGLLWGQRYAAAIRARGTT